MIKVRWNELCYDLLGKAVWIKRVKFFDNFDDAFKYALDRNSKPYCYNVWMEC